MSFTADPTVVVASTTQEVKAPPPATSWNGAAESRTALGLAPFTWSAEWMDAASRFCVNQRVDAGVEYVCDSNLARVSDAREWFDYAWEHRASYATPPTWLAPESMRRRSAPDSGLLLSRDPRRPHSERRSQTLADSLLRRADTLGTTTGTHKSWATVTAQWLVAVGRLAKALEVARSAVSVYPQDP